MITREDEEFIMQQNYLSDFRYISGMITEYDIRAANISVLRERNLISDQEYYYLSNLPKQSREVEIGLKIKNDPKIYTEIQTGIKQAKVELLRANNIDIDKIVRIANDAVYINSFVKLENLKFGNYIEFIPKGCYSIYCNINKILFLLSFLQDGNIDIDIKGVGNTAIDLHKDLIVPDIVHTLILIERSSIVDAVGYLNNIIQLYLSHSLNINYYREFNSDCRFRILHSDTRLGFLGNGDFGIDSLPNNCNMDEFKHMIDINYNYAILRELWSILLELYEGGRRI